MTWHGLALRLLRATLFLTLVLIPIRMPQAMGDAPALGAVPNPLRVLEGTISRNSTLGSLLGGTLGPSGVHVLVEAARPVYDLARLSPGHPFGVAIRPDGLLAAFTYGIDELRTLKVTRAGDDLRAEVVSRDYETRVESVGGTITSSLFGAVAAAGEEDQLALDLADIFAWDVDFNTELQKGDSFRVAVEKLSLDGRFCRYGRIRAAELLRGDRVLRAVHFADATRSGYFAPDGTPLRRAFLRSPLKFTRVSSGFSYGRFHPVLKTTRPHLGVDYAAPTGTPVHAAAEGTVVGAGWMGGYGKAVRLRHANGFESLYGHLSRIGVKVGERVGQGEFVGAVGMTGLATGPHLDYRITRHGVFVNPLKMQSPPAEPIGPASRPAFEATAQAALTLLEGSGVRTASR